MNYRVDELCLCGWNHLIRDNPNARFDAQSIIHVDVYAVLLQIVLVAARSGDSFLIRFIRCKDRQGNVWYEQLRPRPISAPTQLLEDCVLVLGLSKKSLVNPVW